MTPVNNCLRRRELEINRRLTYCGVHSFAQLRISSESTFDFRKFRDHHGGDIWVSGL
jgi:hypothetical protein